MERKKGTNHRIGIFGGTFDPIHYGHLILADQARYEADLSSVIFVPTKSSPFKLNRETAHVTHRYRMVSQAIKGNPYFTISNVEMESEKVSYTVHTLRKFRSMLGEGAELCFITGTDAFLGIRYWSQSEELLQDYSFIVGSRPGYQETALDELITQLRQERECRIYKVHMTEVDISSTDIKAKLQSGRPVRYLLPDSVMEYIDSCQLYR